MSKVMGLVAALKEQGFERIEDVMHAFTVLGINVFYDLLEQSNPDDASLSAALDRMDKAFEGVLQAITHVRSADEAFLVLLILQWAILDGLMQNQETAQEGNDNQ